MADFTVKVVGADVVPWDDPRANERPGFPLQCYRAHLGNRVELRAVVGGVEAPLDSALGGRLFSADLVEGLRQPEWLNLSRSSIIVPRFRFCGHYVVAVRRTGGGAELVPIEVVL